MLGMIGDSGVVSVALKGVAGVVLWWLQLLSLCWWV